MQHEAELTIIAVKFQNIVYVFVEKQSLIHIYTYKLLKCNLFWQHFYLLVRCDIFFDISFLKQFVMNKKFVIYICTIVYSLSSFCHRKVWI